MRLLTALSFTVVRFLINIRVSELPHKHNGFVEEVGPRLKSNYPFLSLGSTLYQGKRGSGNETAAVSRM